MKKQSKQKEVRSGRLNKDLIIKVWKSKRNNNRTTDTGTRTMSEDISIAKFKFEEAYASRQQRNNNVGISDQKYTELIFSVLAAKGKQSNKKPREYWLLKKYDVLRVMGLDKLIRPVESENGEVKYFVKTSELFGVLHEIHLSLGHKGRDAMEHEIKRKYVNVTQNDINLYLTTCRRCHEKKKSKKKGVVVKPIIHEQMNCRGQVDLIDYQSSPSYDFKWVMVYQDHLTKFCLLRALLTKRAQEVALHLFDFFTMFGAPSILHSDNGREFVNRIIENLEALWPGLKIVHGKPRHSQSQGSVERANQDIENMLACWMGDNNTDKWSDGLKVIQFKKNISSRNPKSAI